MPSVRGKGAHELTRIVLVTGGASGIGLALGRRFAESGDQLRHLSKLSGHQVRQLCIFGPAGGAQTVNGALGILGLAVLA